MTNNDVYAFNLQIPIEVPSEAEVEKMGGTLESYLSKLIEEGYLTQQEAVSYIKFTLYLSGVTPFLLDPFLETFRNITPAY